MTEGSRESGADVSLFTLGTALLRNRWRIVRWMGIGGVIAVLLVAFRPALYQASASFVPQGTDASRSGLASLAGQFGIALPSASQSQSPDFYVRLLGSRVILQRVVRDTLVVTELGGRRLPFLDLFKVPVGPPLRREEQGVAMLSRLVGASANKLNGVVELSIATRWPSVSLAIARDLIDGLNEFNQKTRQGQASAERQFIEGRLTIAGGDLRAAEDRLEGFLRSNREFASSPQLVFTRDRLQRDIALKQQVFTALTQSYEDARIREVRDTPVITVIEPPEVSAVPGPRRRLLLTLLGAVLGGLVGAGLVFTSELVARVDKSGTVEAKEFVGAVRQLEAATLESARRLGRWVRR